MSAGAQFFRLKQWNARCKSGITNESPFFWRNTGKSVNRQGLRRRTRILESIEHGNPKAADELLPLVYGELRKLAAAKMRHRSAQPDIATHRTRA